MILLKLYDTMLLLKIKIYIRWNWYAHTQVFIWLIFSEVHLTNFPLTSVLKNTASGTSLCGYVNTIKVNSISPSVLILGHNLSKQYSVSYVLARTSQKEQKQQILVMLCEYFSLFTFFIVNVKLYNQVPRQNWLPEYA